MSTAQSRAYYRDKERRMGRNPDDPHGLGYINEQLAKHPPKPPSPGQEARKTREKLERKLAGAHARGEHPDEDYEMCPVCRKDETLSGGVLRAMLRNLPDGSRGTAPIYMGECPAGDGRINFGYAFIKIAGKFYHAEECREKGAEA